MSYCRFSDADVYLYRSSRGVECSWCPLHPGITILTFERYSDAIAHLDEHVAAGHDVPDYAFDGLRSDMAAEGDLVKEMP